MKTAFRTIVASAALVAAVVIAPVSAPAFMGEDGPAPVGGGIKRITKELQMTPQQQQQLKDIFARNRPQGEPLRKQFMDERRALRSLIQTDTIDEPAIRAQVARLAAVEADMAVHHAHVSKEIRAILTPEQIAKAKELQEQRDKRMEERPAKAGRRIRQGPQ
jgi:Spy/CpxP family protein refolding chaperone